MNIPTIDSPGKGTDGEYESASQDSLVSQILHALNMIHNPRSSNLLRQEASSYLERVKTEIQAPQYGFTFATTKAQPAIVQHYGLSILEYAIRYRWTEYTGEQSTVLRQWVVTLAQGVVSEDPPYIRNKIASLWVEIAKRSWILDWLDMDELLVKLWDGPVVLRELVLVILGTLSEDIFDVEDTAAGLRGTELNLGLVEIFTSDTIFDETFSERSRANTRFAGEGWLSRISNLLCSYAVRDYDDKMQSSIVAALSTLRTVFGWVVPKALSATGCLTHVCGCLKSPNSTIQLGSVDALRALYTRQRLQEDDVRDLIFPMYEPGSVSLLRSLYEWTIVDVTNIDEDKYLLSKKFSELVYNVGRFLSERPLLIPQNIELSSFFNLLIRILSSDSLHVSIPILHLWIQLLNSPLGNSSSVTALMGDLLEICSQRLLNYEALPQDSGVPSIVFLNEDIDTMPEKHAFLGNYARFCNEIIGTIVQKQPFDAIYHIIGQADQVLNHLYDGAVEFQVQIYTKMSIPYLRLDGQFTVVEAALRGYAKWIGAQEHHQNDREQMIMNSNLQTWCERLLELVFEDPMIKQRIVQLASELAMGPLRDNPRVLLRVFEYTLKTRCPKTTVSEVYNQVAKDLEAYCGSQLQRFAMRCPKYLLTVQHEIEEKLQEVFTASELDAHSRIRYSSVLFIITHRASGTDQEAQKARLNGFMQPTMRHWQSNDLTNSLASLDKFCDLLSLGDMQSYLIQKDAHRIEDWSTFSLDEPGNALRSRMQSAIEHLPLRATKTLLTVSLEKLEPGSKFFAIACDIWRGKLPHILPNLLRLIGYAHAFHDPAKWRHLPEDMRGIVPRVLSDRFWQVGISLGSREDFYARVSETKSTMDGFASSVRATIRFIREIGYRLLLEMSLLGEQFYGYDDLSGPLSEALFADACALSTYQMAALVELARPMVENCPSHLRSRFLLPVLALLFQRVDEKISNEWERIEDRKTSTSDDDNLATEMRDESILRQLTFTAVRLVADFLDPQRMNPPSSDSAVDRASSKHETETHHHTDSLRVFILNTPQVLKPIILFCTHALRVRDTRSCSFITRVMRSLIGEFLTDSSVDTEVREYISIEVLKASITSLHEPYFVELQRDLAQLIASVVITYGSLTDTPREVLLSLPGITSARIDHMIHRLLQAQNTRQQRALVLDLLEGLRGISISEQGKILIPDPKKVRSAMQQRYMTVDVGVNTKRVESPDLNGIAEMFQ